MMLIYSESFKANITKVILMQPQTCDTQRALFGVAASFLPKHILFTLVGLHSQTHSKLGISLILQQKKLKKKRKEKV